MLAAAHKPFSPAAVLLGRVSAAISWTRGLIRCIGLLPKLKLCIAYYQCVVYLPEIYSVPFPQQYYQTMAPLKWIGFNWISAVV